MGMRGTKTRFSHRLWHQASIQHLLLVSPSPDPTSRRQRDTNFPSNRRPVLDHGFPGGSRESRTEGKVPPHVFA